MFRWGTVRRRAALSLGVGVLAFGAGVPAARAITGGEPASISTYPWMVQVQQNRGPAWFTTCSGSLIGPHYVLTAGHCTELYPAVGPPLQPDADPLFRLRVILGNGAVVVPVHTYAPSDFNYNAGVGDVAVLQLPDAVTGISPVPVDLAEPTLGVVGTGVGFGCTEANPNACIVGEVLGAVGVPHPMGLGLMRSDQEQVLMAGGLALSPAAGALCGTPVTMICTMGVTGVTRDGDSGGPLLVPVGGGLAQVGVVHDQADTTEANQTGEGNYTTTWTAVAPLAGFLSAFIGH